MIRFIEKKMFLNVKFICLSSVKVNDFDENATRWLCILTYKYTYEFYTMIFMRCHEDTVMLHSTTGSYGRPVIEVAYGEMILSLHRDCVGDDSSRRVVGVST